MQIHEANEILKARVTRVVRGESDVSAAVLIEERYKGKASKKEKIWTDAEESLCGYSFREGHTYLIFAKRLKSKKRLTTHLCSGTRPWDRVDAATLETLNDLRR